MKHSITWLCLLVVLILGGCDSDRIYEKNEGIEGDAWSQGDLIAFEAEITDTTQACNLYINVRNASFYPFRNLFLYVETTFPDQKTVRDTVELLLANESGEWLGSGLGDIWDHQILWKKSVRFPMSGTYRFTFQQAMRMEKLPLIMDVGLRIEKAGNN